MWCWTTSSSISKLATINKNQKIDYMNKHILRLEQDQEEMKKEIYEHVQNVFNESLDLQKQQNHENEINNINKLEEKYKHLTSEVKRIDDEIKEFFNTRYGIGLLVFL